MTQSHGTQDLNGGRVSDERLSLRLDQSEKDLAGAIRDKDRPDYCGPPIWHLEEQVAILAELHALRSEPSEPVAWRYRGPRGGWITVDEKPKGWPSEPLYASPNPGAER